MHHNPLHTSRNCTQPIAIVNIPLLLKWAGNNSEHLQLHSSVCT